MIEVYRVCRDEKEGYRLLGTIAETFGQSLQGNKLLVGLAENPAIKAVLRKSRAMCSRGNYQLHIQTANRGYLSRVWSVLSRKQKK